MVVIDQSAWKFVICALDGTFPSGTGQLFNTSSKQFTYMLNSGRQAQCTLNIDNPVADYVLNNDCLMKVYRRNRLGQEPLLLCGDVVTVEETGSGDTQSVIITAADPFYRLQHRLIGVGVDSLGRGVPYYLFAPDSAGNQVPGELGAGLLFTLSVLNSVGGYTGIAAGSSTGTTQNSAGPIYAAYFSDIVQQTCNTLGGPDFDITPQEPSGAWPNTTIGTLNFYSHLGTLNPQARFEYGTGLQNVVSYDRLIDKTNLANQVLSLPQGYPDVVAQGDNIISSSDVTSILTRTLFQYIVQADQLVDPSLRQELTAETLAVTSTGKQQITFVPSVNNPMDFTVDYNVGDLLIARAFTNGRYRYNGTVRLYGVNFTIDENDAETPALTLAPTQGA